MYIITLFWKPQQVPYLKGKEPAALGDSKPNVELKCSRFTEGRGHLRFLCCFFLSDLNMCTSSSGQWNNKDIIDPVVLQTHSCQSFNNYIYIEDQDSFRIITGYFQYHVDGQENSHGKFDTWLKTGIEHELELGVALIFSFLQCTIPSIIEVRNGTQKAKEWVEYPR